MAETLLKLQLEIAKELESLEKIYKKEDSYFRLCLEIEGKFGTFKDLIEKDQEQLHPNVTPSIIEAKMQQLHQVAGAGKTCSHQNTILYRP